MDGKTLWDIRDMTRDELPGFLEDAIVPRTTMFAFAMNQGQLNNGSLECTHPFRMKTVLHREFEGGIISYAFEAFETGEFNFDFVCKIN